MSEWPATLARLLGEPQLDEAETAALLELAREVAHGTERRFAPLSTFLVGLAVGRGQPDDRTEQTVAVIERVRAQLAGPADEG